jgi:DNA topoisomerase-1
MTQHIYIRDGDKYFVRTGKTKRSERRISKREFEGVVKTLPISVPPNYPYVEITPDSRDIIAKAIDAQGRSQYLYHPNRTNANQRKMLNKMRDFVAAIPIIKNHLTRDVGTGLKASRDVEMDVRKFMAATAIKIMFYCNFRVGNEKYEEDNGTYGTTTLLKNHYNREKGIIEFVGKSGKVNRCILRERGIRTAFEKCIDISPSEYVFSYMYGRSVVCLSADTINQYLKAFNPAFSAKNIRTYQANREFIRLLRNVPFENQKERKKQIDFACERVSDKLHHTKNVCRTKYISKPLQKWVLKNEVVYSREMDFLIDRI